MRKSVLMAAAVWVLISSVWTLPPAMAKGKSEPPPKLKVGDVAPDFKLQYFDGHDLKDVNLSDYRGKQNVVLAFYIFAFTGG